MSAIQNIQLGVSYNKYVADHYQNTLKPAVRFSEFVLGYINRNSVTQSSRNAYRDIIRYINAFCEKTNRELPMTNGIDMQFTEDFVYFLRSEVNLMASTVKGVMEKLTALLNKAALNGHIIDNSFRDVKVKGEDSSPVYLTEDEILKIYFYDDLKPREKEVRDYFVIGCLTGLRHSDYSRLSKENFIQNNQLIRIKTKKTGKPVIVPADKYVIEIMEKYDWQLPKAKCVQSFNACIKRICKKIGFREKVLWERTVGLEVVTRTYEKWEMIGSHTARRSFATNIYKKDEFRTLDIMRMTGHSSEKTFFKYIRYSDEQVALQMVNHPHFRRNG